MTSTRIRTFAAVTIAVAITAAAFSFGPTSAAYGEGSSAPRRLGLYRGAGNVTGAADFESFLGRPVDQITDFFDGSSWASIENPSWIIDRWNSTGTKYSFSWGVPILLNSGTSFAQGAAGAYDSHFSVLAQNLVAKGRGSDTIRLGWEFNGNWFPWSVTDANKADFMTYWRRVVTAMRSVPGANFRFTWNPTLGRLYVAPDSAYPGDAYVDYIGLDAYDGGATQYPDAAARWNWFATQAYGLNWHAAFAAAHGKQMTYDEWGVWAVDGPGGGGGDSPYFITSMKAWITNNNVAYANFWEQPPGYGITAGNYPNAAAAFKQSFGTASSTTTTTTTTTPATTTTTTPTTTTTTTAPTSTAATVSLVKSDTANRTSPTSLADAVVSGNIFISASSDKAISQARFYLDDANMAQPPRQTEAVQPYDFAGTAADGTAMPFDTRSISAGSHVVTVAADLVGGGTVVTSATFTVTNVTTVSYSGSLTSRMSSRTFSHTTGGGTAQFVLTFPKAASLTLTVLSSTGQTVTQQIGASGMKVSVPLAKDTYGLVVSGSSRTSFVLSVTSPV
ncbi:MAG TPA: glycosyl hydrolase [Acidimicrobiales bacterium]|nr:glycosyl hydrolase [Acidimicrobiales bacterium]